MSEALGNLIDFPIPVTRMGDGGPVRVLVIDPDGVSRRMAQDTLTTPELTVEDARDGQGAIEILSREVFDLVLTEVDLGDMTGWQVHRRIAARVTAPHFLFWSSDGRVERRIEAYRKGVEYLAKPVDRLELVARVDSLVRRHRQEQERFRNHNYLLAGQFEALAFGDLLSMLEMSRRSGNLSFLTTAPGVFYFREGRIVRAEFGNLTGAPAFYRALRDRVGQFEFELVGTEVEHDRSVAGVSPTHLLLEAARRYDSARQAVDTTDEVSTGDLVGVGEFDELDGDLQESTAITTVPKSESSVPTKSAITAHPGPPVSKQKGEPWALLKAMQPSVGFSRSAAATLEDGYALGQLRLYTTAELVRWTLASEAQERCTILVVGDISEIISAMTGVCAPPDESVILAGMSGEKKIPGMTFHLKGDRLLDIIGTDFDGLDFIKSGLWRRPALAVVAPRRGDLLSMGVHGRVKAELVLSSLSPALCLGVGDKGMSKFLAELRALCRLPIQTPWLEGVLGEGGLTLRSVLSRAILAWGEGPAGGPTPWT